MGRKAGNGEGSIRQRTDGRWEARITLLDGRRKSFMVLHGPRSRRSVPRPLGTVTKGLWWLLSARA